MADGLKPFGILLHSEDAGTSFGTVGAHIFEVLVRQAANGIRHLADGNGENRTILTEVGAVSSLLKQLPSQTEEKFQLIVLNALNIMTVSNGMTRHWC